MDHPDPARDAHEERPPAAGSTATEWLGEAAERLVRPYAEMLADRIDAAAAGLRTAADRMGPAEERDSAAEGLRRTAEQGESLAHSARHDPMEQLIDQATEFARARPAVFLGATAAAGWALGLALQGRTTGGARPEAAGSSVADEMQQSPYRAQEQSKP